jgi:hypothetical protein
MNKVNNILFYSRQCAMCSNVLNILKNENLISHFKLFCVDDNLNSIPTGITKVPTMMVTGVDKLLVESEIFEWIKQVKFLKQNINSIQHNVKNNGPIGWIEHEMNGKSDGYAYKDVDKAMMHAYSGFNETSNDIYTPKESNKKINFNQQFALINEVKNGRSEQDNIYEQMNKEQQLEKMLQLNNRINK